MFPAIVAGATESTLKQTRRAFRAACALLEQNDGAAALSMDISDVALSQMLRGDKHLSFYRLSMNGPNWFAWFLGFYLIQLDLPDEARKLARLAAAVTGHRVPLVMALESVKVNRDVA